MSKYGPHNPHPLSQMKTELVWEGKYDEFGQRREINVADSSMPLQKIETIDEPRSRAEAQGNLFDESSAHRDDFRNRLVWGDNKLVLASLLEEFTGRVDLIYIDPPFDVGADFKMKVPIGDLKDNIQKDQSLIEMVAYRDLWGKGSNSYLHIMFERLSLMKELLSEHGSIYLHIDYRVASMMRLIMDEIFGKENFQNQIIWCYKERERVLKNYNPKHDVILFYSKSPSGLRPFNWKFAAEEYSEVTLKKFKYEDEVGKYQIRGKNQSGSPVQAADGLTPADEEKHPNLTYRDYLHDREGVAPRDWWTIPIINKAADERTGYNTQKPEGLLERIIQVSSDEGGIVADFFCGSGTTGAVAEKLGRKWIMSDLGRFAVHTSRKRMIDQQRNLNDSGEQYRSFDVYNLGRYERQWWQQDTLQGAEDEHRNVVLKFFRAETLSQPTSPLIHGRKGNAFVHVDGIDSLFTREEAKEVASAVIAAGGKQVHCLAWDFEMEIRQAITALETELDIKIRLHRIPREIMERNRTEVPPFFEIALLQAEPVTSKTKGGTTVDIKLTNFLPSLAEVPSKELEALQERAVESGFDFIDFWAIDFNWHPNMPFNHHWQDYRTRKHRSLKTVSNAEYKYDKPGTYTACVKVVDVFGCDTSITVEIKV